MCGFLAAYSPNGLKIDESLKNHLIDPIKYRGRDQTGFWKSDLALVAHTRLSIIDLESGAQPMHDHTDRYVIVFNGEIYNFLELRKDYSALGATFKTHSDTEVILEGFKLKKEKVLNDLIGMFAFCIWDKLEKKMVVARDRLGKKPLYWTKVGDTFYFSSSMSSFSVLSSKKINTNYLNQFRNIGSSIDNSTIWENVFSFPMASYGYLDGRPHFKTHSYWNLNFRKDEKSSESDFLEEYDALIVDAVKIRLRSDVPLCLTFSGGVDSGTIASVISKRLNQQVNLYCIDYDSDSSRSSEILQAKRVAQHLGLPIEVINYDYQNVMLKDFVEAYKNFDQPCKQFALVYSSILYQCVSKKAKVTLSGNGADEIFTGYNGDEAYYFKNLAYKKLYPLLKILKLQRIHPTFQTGILEHYLNNLVDRNYVSAGAFDLLKQTVNEANVYDYYDIQMYMSLMYGARDSNFILPDVAGLTNQVEVRSPFLDHRIVEFAAKLPLKYKIHLSANGKFTTKYLPKKYYERYVPNSLAYSPKKGMGYNLNWHISIAKDPEYNSYFKESIARFDNSNLIKESFLTHLEKYCHQINAGSTYATNSPEVLFGFMVSEWLKTH